MFLKTGFLKTGLTVSLFALAVGMGAAQAQTPANLVALQGLGPVSTLPNSPEGKSALSANYTITGGIQNGAIVQPLLLPFAEQQQLALRDAFITGGNATELADGLGTKLAAVYQARTQYTSPKAFTSLSPAVAALITYAAETTGSDANMGKYFFANKTTNSEAPVSEAASAILSSIGGVTDVFGKAYGLPAGSTGADRFGNSRPFQTEPVLQPITGADYFGAAASNTGYLRGPFQDLTNSPSFPSGHTTYGYTESVLLALLVPERYQQAITRGAEYGNDRVILGAHYVMDVIGGRTVALHGIAQLLANNPIYVGKTQRHGPVITDFRAALATARADMTAALQTGCGNAVAVCAKEDTGRFAVASRNAALYNATQTYGLPVVYPEMARKLEDVGQIAPEAGNLLTAAFPYLTLDQANAILTATEGPGGGFLDNGSAFGLYSRLNLYAAAQRAAALVPAR
jgi:hypothetical protein